MTTFYEKDQDFSDNENKSIIYSKGKWGIWKWGGKSAIRFRLVHTGDDGTTRGIVAGNKGEETWYFFLSNQLRVPSHCGVCGDQVPANIVTLIRLLNL